MEQKRVQILSKLKTFCYKRSESQFIPMFLVSKRPRPDILFIFDIFSGFSPQGPVVSQTEAGSRTGPGSGPAGAGGPAPLCGSVTPPVKVSPLFYWFHIPENKHSTVSPNICLIRTRFNLQLHILLRWFWLGSVTGYSVCV